MHQYTSNEVEYQNLINLRNKHLRFKDYRLNNQIEFVDYEKYPEQTEIIDNVIKRIRTGS